VTAPASAPPQWAEAWLRALLPQRDRETVSGDLLEAYRECIRPRRSRWGADFWYVAQVARFAAPLAPWAALVASIFVCRTVLDWFAPAGDQKLRADVTTVLVFGAPLLIGFVTTWRTESITSGAVGTITALSLAAVMAAAVTALVYVVGAAQPSVIARTGGLTEAFLLPFMVVMPGGVGGWLGGAAERGLCGLGRRVALIARRLNAD
jgi:hypothetical protein